MNRIGRAFAALSAKNEKMLVGFVTAGDPSFDRSLELIKEMCSAGLDLLELGVPFSDPTADGPVIQRSSGRALKAGISLTRVLEMSSMLRKHTNIPIVLFSYYNPILSYGLERFHDDAVGAGVDGLLVVDLPPEEAEEMTSLWPDNSLDLIRLIAPTTPVERMARIAAGASGFLYLVSMTAVTGSAGLDIEEVKRLVATVKKTTRLPICVGFGISKPEQVAAISTVADGVVVGSAFERLIEENLTNPDLPKLLADYVRTLKAATKIA